MCFKIWLLKYNIQIKYIYIKHEPVIGLRYKTHDWIYKYDTAKFPYINSS